MDCAAFSVSQMAVKFEAFGRWLSAKVDAHKAAITIHRYLPFFMEIERRWKTIPDLDALLGHFGTQRLRHVLLPMRWMEENRYIVSDAAAKMESSDRRRIAATLDRFLMGSRERAILEGYLTVLKAKKQAGNTTLRSIRLALAPAAALMQIAKEIDRVPPDQRALSAYLKKTPGQRAAISGFVTYLRDTYKAEISLPRSDSGKVQGNRRKKLEAEMLALMREQGEDEELSRRWLTVALAYFHGLPKKVGRNIQRMNIGEGEEGGLTVTWNGQRYWIPLLGTTRS